MLSGIFEVIIYVQDMHAQVAFYRDVLGLGVTYPEGLDDYDDQYWVTFDTGACTLCLHGGGTGQQGADAAKYVFGTADVEAARAQLIERGVRVSEIRQPSPGVRVFDGRDPEGNVFSVESQ